MRRALLHLAELQDKSVHARLRKQLNSSEDPRAALNSLFALYGGGGLDEVLAQQLLHHPLAPLRKWIVRYLGDADGIAPQSASLLADLAANEQDVMVLSQLACTAKRLPSSSALPIVWNLVRNGQCARDPQLPLLIWWAIEGHAIDGLDAILDFLEMGVPAKAEILRETVLPRLIRRYAVDASELGDRACVRLLALRHVQ